MTVRKHTDAEHEDFLAEVVGKLVRAAEPGNLERIVLFGSRARGDYRADSDLDLVLVEKRPLADGDEQWDAIWRYRCALKNIGIARDILVVDRNEVREAAAHPTRFLTRVLNDGETLYARHQ